MELKRSGGIGENVKEMGVRKKKANRKRSSNSPKDQKSGQR